MDYTNAMLCWTPNSDQVALVPWPDNIGRSRRYHRTGGAAFVYLQEGSFELRKLRVFIDAVHLIIRDHVDPQAVHKALYELDEYRDGLSEDFPKPKVDR